MAGRIPQHFIDELVTRVDIVDVIASRIELKKAGHEYKARCPFHDEKTPSFTVSQTKQFYHCFGCGAHGSAIAFLMEYENLGFVETIEELAGRAGLEVPREGAEEPRGPDPTPVYEVLERASAWFRRQLREHAGAARAVDYLKGRGLDGRTAARFQMGFAPPGWSNLLGALGGSTEHDTLLERAGLTIRRDDGSCYDRFRDRVMFPILDRRGRTVGFGGRVLGDDTPKYMNSPETDVFHKGRELYGLHQARRSSTRLDRVLVVEGYMDVVALGQAGIDNAVATLGTAATHEHLEALFRAAGDVVFCFDGDEAGRRAAWRALENALPVMRDGRQAFFMFLPDGEDPDTLVRRIGADAFEERVGQAATLGTFLFEHLGAQVDLGTVDGGARFIELARPLMDRLPAGSYRGMMAARLTEFARPMLDRLPPGPERDQAAARLVTLTGLDGAESSTLSRKEHGGPPRPLPEGARERGHGASPVRRAVTLLVHHPSLAGAAPEASAVGAVDLPGCALLGRLIDMAADSPNLTTGALLEHFRDDPAGRHLEKLAREEVPEPSPGLEREFADCVRRILDSREESRYRELLSKARARQMTQEERREFAALSTRGARGGSPRNEE